MRKNLKNLFLAAALAGSLGAVSCSNPLPFLKDGVINVNFPEGPYSYEIDVSSEDNSGYVIPKIIAPGNTGGTFRLPAPKLYDFTAQGVETVNTPTGNVTVYHNAKETYDFTVNENSSYDISFTFN